jgi:hypothetical protein
MRLTMLAIINILLVIIGIITVSVSISYLPSTGGTVPQEMTLEQYQARQHDALLKSTAFKLVIVGCSITATGILMALVRIYIDNRRERQRYNNTVLPVEIQDSKVSPVKRSESVAMAKPETMAKPENMAKPEVKYSTGALGPTGPRGPVIFHKPIVYHYNNNNTPDPKWYNYIPPRPILKVKREPIVEII